MAAEAPVKSNFQIVPLKALPFVGLIFITLIIGITTNRLWILDFYHVVGGGLWTAIDLFVGFIVGPILGTLSIPARMEFSKKFMPKMLVLMPTLVIMTLAAGWQLARHQGFILSSDKHHGWVVGSMVVVGVMAVIALGILEPANIAVLYELRKPQPNGERIGRLMKRFLYTAGITGAMQVATLIVMTRIATL
ncbi:MAG: hypothetical protein WCO08_06655 [Actinomycetes bacterium]